MVKTALLVVSLLTLACIGRARVWVWHDERTLWADAATKAPNKPRAILNYARMVERDGDLVTAKQLYEVALEKSLRPQQSEYTRRFTRSAAATNLGHLLVKAGDLDGGALKFRGVIADWPRFAPAHFNLGVVHWMKGECVEAAQEFRIALVIDKDLPKPPPCIAHS